MDYDESLFMPSDKDFSWKARSGFSFGLSMWFRQLLWRDVLSLLLRFTNFLTFGLCLKKRTTINDCNKMTWAYCKLEDSFLGIKTLTIYRSTTTRPMQNYDDRA